MSDEKQITIKPDVSRETSVAMSLCDPNAQTALEKTANIISKSGLIPSHYRGKPSDCFIAVYRAERLGMDPFGFMEGTYVVHGKMAFNGQMYIALINISGLFEHSVRFDMKGDESDVNKMSCTAWTLWKGTKAKVTGYCSVEMAMSEGWWQKNPKWKSLTRLMLQYRAAAFLVRTNCPEIAMGYKLDDEIIDVSGEPTINAEAEGKNLFGSGGTPTTNKPAPVETKAEVVETTPVEPVVEEPSNAEVVGNVHPIGTQGVGRDDMIASLKDAYKGDKFFMEFLCNRGMLAPDELLEDIKDMALQSIWNFYPKFKKTYESEKSKR